MKKKKIMNRFIVVSAILFMSVVNISAQVTIGKLAAPHAAAVLDLSQVPSRNLGLLMPRVELKALNSFLPLTGAEADAAGMWLYNTAYSPAYDPTDANSFCPGTYVYNGTDWNRIGEACPEIPVTAPLTITTCANNITVPSFRFMAYNLGADPALDTPKKQMKYLATHPFDAYDARVYGGTYQWGRGNLAHGATLDGTYRRYNATPVTSQTDTPEDDKFYYGQNDWRINSNNALWGNGALFVGQDDDYGGVKFTDDKYYQNTDWSNPLNNPCPKGFRVPSLDEWERLLAYDCIPNSAGGALSDITTSGKLVSENGLTWVPVVCNRNNNGQCVPDNSWTENITSSGYAIYLTTVWNAATTYQVATIDAKSLHDDDAPEPLLFLPATGSRNGSTAAPYYVGQNSYYWSSMPSDSGQAYALRFVGNNARPNLHNRADGIAVRCVR
jgi:hypothetical protein